MEKAHSDIGRHRQQVLVAESLGQPLGVAIGRHRHCLAAGQRGGAQLLGKGKGTHRAVPHHSTHLLLHAIAPTQEGQAQRPPSTGKSIPVMFFARSLAKNTTASATSTGVPVCPSGKTELIIFIPCSTLGNTPRSTCRAICLFIIAVPAIADGTTELQRML